MISEDRFDEFKARFDEITVEMSKPDIATDPVKMAEFGRENARLEPIVTAINRFIKLRDDLPGLREMAADESDSDMAEMAREEINDIEAQLTRLDDDLQVLLIPVDPLDAKSAIVEIRAGTGGDEASLFAGDLFRLYTRYGEICGWKTDVMSRSLGSKGGFKEIVFSIEGDGVFGTMKYESGVHRVQRVPATESSGRIHTSAATVAVLPEAEDVEVQIRQEDIEVDVYRSSGPGGQSVNTTDSAVRITHIPTGIVVTCQDEKSQHKNKDKAMRVLRARLFEMEQARLNDERSEARRSMIGSGDRSGKIRTYNWPQGRVTDHRLEGDDKNHALQGVVNGNLQTIHRALKIAENARNLGSSE